MAFAFLMVASGLASRGWAQPVSSSGTEASPVESSKLATRTDRPRIGLALSGGGARGLAHVGVLQALESMNVPIDYIAGTSMGAVVGGMYALGMSPDEIEAELAAVDWTDMFRGSAARKDLSFRRKEDERKFLYGAEIGFTADGIRFPGGTIPSVSLDFFLDSLSLRYGPTGSFDDLAVPFRAVASDVRSGEVVILDDGELSTAVRASMAVPGVLAPVQIGPYSLVDGGVLDNLPVEVVESMGADIVIAVDVASPLLDAKEVQSAPSIASQALSLALEQRNVESRGEADILIRPDLGKLSPLDFGQVVATMPLGREATLAVADRLADLSDPQTSTHLYALQRRTPSPLPMVESIEISGPTRVDSHRIRRRIHTRIGEVVDLEVLRHDLARVFSIGEFSSVRFAFEEPREQGRLVIRVEDKDWGPNYLRLGLGFSDDLEGSNGVSARLNYTMTNLNRYGGEWRNEIQTGRTRGLLTEFFQPLDYEEHFFIAPRVVSRQAVSDIFVERTKIAEYEVESHSLGLDFGLEFGKYGEFRLGLRRGIAKADARVGDPGLPELEVDTGAMVGRLVIDRLDSSGVPRRGTLADVNLFVSETSLGADDTYQKLGGETSTYFTHGRHTGFVGLSGGSSLGSDTPAYDAFLVGGLFSFSGYSVGELRGNYYAVARSGYFYRLYDLPVAFGTAIYVGGWVEGGNVWQDSSEIDLEDPLGSFTLALAIDTRFGPVYLAHGLADDGESQFYFRLGNSF